MRRGTRDLARRILGTTVIGGMQTATLIAICLVPVTFYVVERLGGAGRRAPEPRPRETARSVMQSRVVSAATTPA